MIVLFWIIVLIVSITILVKSADWLVESAEKIGLAIGMSPFIVGVTVVAIGTSFPELVSAMVAVFKESTEIVAANVIGSNIANIFLIIGISSIVAGKLIVKRSLIDLDAPLLASITCLFVFIILDGKIVFYEGLFLLSAFFVYLFYTVKQKEEEEITGKKEITEVLPSRVERREKEIKRRGLKQIKEKTYLLLLIGIIGLIVGANYTVESIIKLSEIFKISTSLITITVLALGTSLPELAVSIGAAKKKKYEIALGNVFGSNVFNILLVAGVPALITDLSVDALTLTVGLPFLVIATVLFVVSGISRRIHLWEGLMYVMLYILFLIKLVNF